MVMPREKMIGRYVIDDPPMNFTDRCSNFNSLYFISLRRKERLLQTNYTGKTELCSTKPYRKPP